MSYPHDDALDEPRTRLTAVARLLATGLLRLHTRTALVGPDVKPLARQNVPESAVDRLATSPPAWLTVPAG
jgi:hypothetical protein